MCKELHPITGRVDVKGVRKDMVEMIGTRMSGGGKRWPTYPECVRLWGVPVVRVKLASLQVEEGRVLEVGVLFRICLHTYCMDSGPQRCVSTIAQHHA